MVIYWLNVPYKDLLLHPCCLIPQSKEDSKKICMLYSVLTRVRKRKLL